MKKLLLFLLLLLQFNFSKAQVPFPDSAATWVNANYDWVWGSSPIPTKVLNNVKNYCVNGTDTIINSLKYTRLYKCGGAYRGGLRDNTNGKIYFIPKDSLQEYLLYDFTLTIGDAVTYYIENMYGGDEYAGTSTVQGITTVVVNGISRRKIWFGGGAWIEGIGCSQGLLAEPWANVSNYQRELNCMSLNDSSLFQFSSGMLSPSLYGTCDLTLAINESTKSDLQFSIYPNPFRDKFQIDIKEKKISLFEITNVLGEVILKTQVINDTKEIDLSPYKNGIYFIRVFDKEGNSAVQKVVKQ